MAIPNYQSMTSMYLKTAKGALTTGAATMLNNAAASNKSIKIESCIITNIDGANAADVTVSVYDQDDIGGTATALVSTLSVAPDSAWVIIDATSPQGLQEDMSLGGLASANGDLVYNITYWEVDDA